MSKKILFFPLLLLAVAMMAEQKLTVLDMNNQEQNYALSQIGKLTFEKDVMYLYDKNGVLLGSAHVGNVKQVVMTEENETALSDIANKLYIYPNPTQDKLIIRGLDTRQAIRIYDLQGNMLSVSEAQSTGAQIDVSSLPGGTYLLQVGTQVVKFIKE